MVKQLIILPRSEAVVLLENTVSNEDKKDASMLLPASSSLLLLGTILNPTSFAWARSTRFKPTLNTSSLSSSLWLKCTSQSATLETVAAAGGTSRVEGVEPTPDDTTDGGTIVCPAPPLLPMVTVTVGDDTELLLTANLLCSSAFNSAVRFLFFWTGVGVPVAGWTISAGTICVNAACNCWCSWSPQCKRS